jgi:hypothetical protein
MIKTCAKIIAQNHSLLLILTREHGGINKAKRMKKSPLVERSIKMGLKLFDEPDQYGKTPNAKGMGKKPQVPRFMKKTGECNIRQVSAKLLVKIRIWDIPKRRFALFAWLRLVIFNEIQVNNHLVIFPARVKGKIF